MPSRSLTFPVEVFIAQVRVHLLLMNLVKGFFTLVPEGKKCALGSALGVGTAHRVEPIHAGCSAGGFLHGRSWCVDAVSRRLVETSGLRSRSLAAWVKAGTGPSSCVSLRLLWEEFLRVFLSFVLAQFALGMWYIISLVLASGSHCSGCLGVADVFENWILREMTFLRGCNAWYNSGYILWWLWKNLHIFYVVADSFPEALFLHSV